MEVEVLHHHGIPVSSVISIRAGSTRRQAHLSQLDRPFKFPIKPEECTAVKVDILDLSGSARVACQAGVRDYSVPLESPIEGEPATGMEVDLRLKPLGGGGKDGGKCSEDEDQARDKKKEAAAKAYLEKHGLTGFMQFLIQSLMKDKPDDPYAFLQRQVTKRMMASQTARGEIIPEESRVGDLLVKLSEEAGESVPADQLQDLEKKAEQAGEQLRKDNEDLKDTVSKLKSRYKALLVEDSKLATEAQGKGMTGGRMTQSISPMRLDATFGNLATMQDEVSTLAAENAELVGELVRIRQAVDSIRDEIDELKPGEATG